MCSVVCSIGPFTIYSYGLLVAIGFLAGTSVVLYLAKKENISKDKIMDLVIYIFISGLIGARLLYILTNLKYYISQPLSMFKVWEGGLVYYGGFIFAIITFFWFAKKNNLLPFKVADVIIPGVALGQSIGRIGCFMNGCCYGKSSSKFGIIFKSLDDNIHHMPTQLIESLGVFIIFIILILPKKKFNGEIFLNYIFYYGFFRFLIEFIRGDDRGLLLFSIVSISQFISILLIITAIIFYNKIKNNGS